MTPRVPILVLLVAVTALGARTAWQDRTADKPGEHDTATRASPAYEEQTGAVDEGAASDGPPPSAWYCAAGTAGDLADHVVVLVNPTDRSVGANLTVFFDDEPDSPAASTSRPYRVAVPARQELRIGLAGFEPKAPYQPPGSPTSTAPPSAAPEQPAAVTGTADDTFLAALVEVDEVEPGRAGAARHAMVRVEHAVAGPHGEATGPCATRGASEWHFAWGSTTRDARDVLVLFNPFPSDVVVDARFITPDGVREPVRWQGLTVPGGSLKAIEVGDDVTRRSHVAATVRARTGSLVIERFQTFDGTLNLAEGMRLALGRPVPVHAASFPGATGATGATESSELIVLYNPTEDVAELEVAIRPEDPAVPEPVPFHVVVQPGQFETLDYAQEARVPAGLGYRTMVRSVNDVPFVPEQVLTDGGGS